MTPRKRLVVCFDGTWNSAEMEDSETNVARIARAIHATHSNDGTQQSVLYLRGVGTDGTGIDRAIGGAFGQGVSNNIRSAYMFLAQNYLPARDVGGQAVEADEIYLFGFSRGAFTARSLAGFISSCGLLKRRTLADLPKAWEYYRKTKRRSPEDFCKQNRSDCHKDAAITFVGVWDTVGALGVPTTFLGSFFNSEFEFHDTSPSKKVKNAFHALAIDEHRDEFVPTLWTGTQPPGTTIEQVWFAGAHSDVGGGYQNRTLADIPLAWMAEKAEGCGLAVDWTVLPDRQALQPLAAQHDSRQGWSMKDRLTPTWRQIAGRAFDVDAHERLYFPSENGQPLKTINESLHPSVA